MEVEMADESAGGAGGHPAAAGSLVALVDALPGELCDRATGTRFVADVEPGCDGDELHFAFLPLDLEEGRPDQIERVVVPEVHFRNAPAALEGGRQRGGPLARHQPAAASS